MPSTSSSIRLQTAANTQHSFLRDVIAGLSESRKTLPSKYFYDQKGCQLFDQICQLPEYYPTRTELAIMDLHGQEMAACLGENNALIEFGSGSSIKTQILLSELENLSAYVPLDIAPTYLHESTKRLQQRHPQLKIIPVCADFTADWQLPDEVYEADHRTFYFPGSTIGNLKPPQAIRLLQHIRRAGQPSGGLLLGVDRKKSADILEAAYNDATGVTAAFNLNLLSRINQQLDGNFALNQFVHHAFYNTEPGRIEMHLVSQLAQEVQVAGHVFHFEKDETIRTELSHKYSLPDIQQMAAAADMDVAQVWSDPQDWFSVFYMQF
ncbi:MAG: L-histidine N(alpha)-methyltransferase [Pirellulaceae bacterium]